MDCMHDLHHREALLRGEILTVPHLGEGGAHTVIHHRLIVRQEHRNEARVGRPLYVVLPAQRVQTCAGFANIAGHQCQRDQTARIVGAVNVLAHTHAPENHARFALGKGPRCVAQQFWINTADRLHRLRAEVLQVRFHLVPVLGELRDIGFVIKFFFDDYMHDRVKHGHIRARLELQLVAGMTAKANTPRVTDNQLAAAFGELFEISRRHRVVLNWVTANRNGHIGVFDLIKRRGHRAGADVLQ
mmetsp:Transcript_27859/g.52040  ORF Transcript_27859/g.52040 Transcript_27859/m.52040 type:complete len:244 (+) Transcript_27859:494-1225(+)